VRRSFTRTWSPTSSPSPPYLDAALDGRVEYAHPRPLTLNVEVVPLPAKPLRVPLPTVTSPATKPVTLSLKVTVTGIGSYSSSWPPSR
jgi:hypothetical protein